MKGVTLWSKVGVYKGNSLDLAMFGIKGDNLLPKGACSV